MGSRKEQVGRFCPYCGAVITVDEPFCRSCHKKLADLGHLDAPSTSQPETYIVAGPRVWASGLLSFIAVGLGQFNNGDTFRGLAFGIAFLLVSFGSFGGQYRMYLCFGIWAAAIAEAMVSARRIGYCQRPYAGRSVLLWIGLAVLAAVVILHLMTGRPDITYLQKMFPFVNLWTMV
jgi:hypothetical protein